MYDKIINFYNNYFKKYILGRFLIGVWKLIQILCTSKKNLDSMLVLESNKQEPTIIYSPSWS